MSTKFDAIVRKGSNISRFPIVIGTSPAILYSHHPPSPELA